jgi:hypothetical protein
MLLDLFAAAASMPELDLTEMLDAQALDREGTSTPINRKPISRQNTALARQSSFPQKQPLILDVPLPDEFLRRLPIPSALPIGSERATRLRRESLVVRYSAVSCRPDEFASARSGHTLRCQLYGKPRRTRVMVSIHVTEDDADVDVHYALQAAMQNIAAMDGAVGVDQLDPPVRWREVVVVVTGCTQHMQPGTIHLLRRLGLFTPPDPLPTPDQAGWAGQIHEVSCSPSQRAVGGREQEETKPDEATAKRACE